MSFNAQSKAWNIELKSTAKLVLLCLAEHADDVTLEAFPAITRIVQRTGLNRKTVISSLADLEAMGLVEVVKKFGAGNTYKLHLDRQPVPKTELVKSTASAQTDTKNGTATSPKNGTSTENGPVPKTGLNQYQKRDLTSTENGTLISHEPVNNQSNKTIGVVASAEPKSGKRRKVSLPENFSVTPLMVQWAQKNAPSIDLVSETEKFKDYHTAKASTFADWTAAWRTWIRNAATFSRGYAPARAVSRSRHSGFEQINYYDGLKENADGSHSF